VSHILGLDISTSCTGWCITDLSGGFVDMGYISLSPKLTTFQKANTVQLALIDIHTTHNITKIAVEENLQAFRPGFSSAKTLLSLARFNGIVSYIAQQQFLIEPDFINVNVARKVVGLKVISKRKGGLPTKEQVINWVDTQVDFTWPMKTLKSGPRKGQLILEPGCFDAADAYVIATAGSII
jgi:Holliday junction resolvasome RuvABC endonuclease subunit